MQDAFEYLKQTLSEGQTKMILHILSCDSKHGNDNSLHIADAIGSSQSNVHTGLNKLKDTGFLKVDDGKGTEKIYRLTSKGLATAFLLDCNYEDFLKYCKAHYSDAYWAIIQLSKKMDSRDKRRYFLKSYFQYLFENDMLQEVRVITDKEAKKFMVWLAFKAQMAMGDPDSIKDMPGHYGVTREFLKEGFEEMERTAKRARQILDNS